VETVQDFFDCFFDFELRRPVRPIAGGQMALETPCGHDCKRAILAAAAWVATSERVNQYIVADQLVEVCEVFING
jgi:hypothetical protein